ncbi:unnamed protein product [Lathyrus sativus]|nr:unnamed protein product [Lathyrus sativus]
MMQVNPGTEGKCSGNTWRVRRIVMYYRLSSFAPQNLLRFNECFTRRTRRCTDDVAEQILSSEAAGFVPLLRKV